MLVQDFIKSSLSSFKALAPSPTTGSAILVLLSCVLFFTQTSSDASSVGIGAATLQDGRVHDLLVFPFYHRTGAQLALNVAALLILCSSVERGVGTVRFLLLFPLLSTGIGLLYSILDLLQDPDMRCKAEGFIPVTLGCVALSAAHSTTPRSFLCGLSIPTMALPFALLVVCTALIPGSVLPCNVIGVLIGLAFGKVCFSSLDMSVARAAVVEKMMPFRLLRGIRWITFVPAATEERRKTLLPQINPTPGSYPVQSYAPLSSVNNTNDGWSHLSSSGDILPHAAHTHGHMHGHSHEHNHGHSHGHNHGHSGHSCNHSHG